MTIFRSLLLLIFTTTLFAFQKAYSQPNSHIKFSLNGIIVGKDTGSIILWHSDSRNKWVADTVKLDKARFHFSGTVNCVSEALLWTDLKNRNFDDPSVIRFLLEPANMSILYKTSTPLNPVINGSRSQSEKDNWDNVKLPLLTLDRQYFKTYASLIELSKTDSTPAIKDQIDQISKKIVSVSEKIKLLDIQYINKHPTAYLSAYLLSHHKHNLSVDSIEKYFMKLPDVVKTSSLGHEILGYVYPLTNNDAFRRANPLIDKEFDQRLRELHSVHQLLFKDSSDHTIPLSSFSGKYLVIDFWASWCKPCVEDLPALNQLIKHYSPDTVEFISISVDYDLNAWKQVIRQHHLTGIQLSDTVGFASLASMYCKVVFVPTYLIADQKGRIVTYHAPTASEPELKTLIDRLIRPGSSYGKPHE